MYQIAPACFKLVRSLVSFFVQSQHDAFRCDPGCSIDYRTYEWETHGRSELLPEER